MLEGRESEHDACAVVLTVGLEQTVGLLEGPERPAGQQLDRAGPHEGLGPGDVARERGVVESRGGVILGLVPRGRALVEVAEVLPAGASQPGDDVAAQQLVGVELLAPTVDGGDHARGGLHVLEDLGRLGIAGQHGGQFHRDRRARAGGLDEAALPIVELGQDLVHHVVGDRAVVAGEVLHHRGRVG